MVLKEKLSDLTRLYVDGLLQSLHSILMLFMTLHMSINYCIITKVTAKHAVLNCKTRTCHIKRRLQEYYQVSSISSLLHMPGKIRRMLVVCAYHAPKLESGTMK